MLLFFCSFWPWLIALGAALLGGIIGWLLRRNKITELENTIQGKDRSYLQLKGDYDNTMGEYNGLMGRYGDLEVQEQSVSS